MTTKHSRDRTVQLDNVVSMNSNSEWNSIAPLSYSDMKNSTPPPIQNILHPWLPTQGIAFIYAATGVGKTLFTLNVAYAIASGGNFLKYKAAKPVSILYVDGEMAYNQVHARFIQIIQQQGELDEEVNWHLLNPESFPNQLMPKINTPEGQEFYLKKMNECGAEVLFLDNLSVLSSIDENVSEQWSVVQNWFITLRSLGKTVVVVHHAGKDVKGYRGTSRMLDCADTAISLQDISKGELENENTDSRKFKIEYHKSRTFGGKDSMPFEVTLTKTMWQFQSIELTTTERIIEMLKLNMVHKEIAAELGFARSYVSRLVRKAIKDGLIKPD